LLVVKVFLQQILAGGPVTVTHAETSRYFLTLHEAVDLILLASELPGDGKILIPDLGKPVKILDLACRNDQRGRIRRVHGNDWTVIFSFSVSTRFVCG
jgi:FlaA1/EpsC-like NDP-sugar epimerase